MIDFTPNGRDPALGENSGARAANQNAQRVITATRSTWDLVACKGTLSPSVAFNPEFYPQLGTVHAGKGQADPILGPTFLHVIRMAAPDCQDHWKV